MKSEHAQTPVLSIGTPIEFGEINATVKAIKSYTGMNGQPVPFVEAQTEHGEVIRISHSYFEEALQLS